MCPNTALAGHLLPINGWLIRIPPRTPAGRKRPATFTGPSFDITFSTGSCSFNETVFWSESRAERMSMLYPQRCLSAPAVRMNVCALMLTATPPTPTRLQRPARRS